MPTWNHLTHYVISTLPASEEGVLHNLLQKVELYKVLQKIVYKNKVVLREEHKMTFTC